MENGKYCVIMAGGVGSRFWPISRQAMPKQFLDILGTGKTFLRMTFERFLPVVPRGNFLVVTNSQYKDIVLRQLPEIAEHQVLCEPIGRNTAPCVAYAAFRLNAMNPLADMIVTPADHLILNEDKFRRVIGQCVDFIDRHDDTMVTIGIKPTNPNTGYGYIQVEDAEAAEEGLSKVKTFTEKPGAEMARAFLESGEFYWNSGIFIWKVRTILRAFEQFLPETFQLFESMRPAFNTMREPDNIARIYPQCRGESIDIGIMEKARNTYVRCSDFGWSDIGTWGALYDYSEKDERGNASPSDAALYNTEGCLVKVPEDKLVVIEGLKDYMVVESGNVLLICPRSSEQNVKAYKEEVKFREGEGYI